MRTLLCLSLMMTPDFEELASSNVRSNFARGSIGGEPTAIPRSVIILVLL